MRKHRGPSLAAELDHLERTDPAVAKAAAGLDALRMRTLNERIKVLEGHRETWRRIAFQLSDLVVAGELAKAQAFWAEVIKPEETTQHKGVTEQK